MPRFSRSSTPFNLSRATVLIASLFLFQAPLQAQVDAVYSWETLTLKNGEIIFTSGTEQTKAVDPETVYSLWASPSNQEFSGNLVVDGSLPDGTVKIGNAAAKSLSAELLRKTTDNSAKDKISIDGNKTQVKDVFIASRYGNIAGLLGLFDNSNEYNDQTLISGSKNVLAASGTIDVNGAAHLAGAKFNFFSNETLGTGQNVRDSVFVSLTGNGSRLEDAVVSFNKTANPDDTLFMDFFGGSVSVERYGLENHPSNVKPSEITVSENIAVAKNVLVGGGEVVNSDHLRIVGGNLWLQRTTFEKAHVELMHNVVQAENVKKTAPSSEETNPAFVSVIGSLAVTDTLKGSYEITAGGNTVQVKDSDVDLVAGTRLSSINADGADIIIQQPLGNTVVLEGNNNVSQGVFGTMYMFSGNGSVNISGIQPRINLLDGKWHPFNSNNTLIVRGSTKAGGLAGFDHLILHPTMENASLDKSMLIIDGFKGEGSIDPSFSPIVDFSGSHIDILVEASDDLAGAGKDTTLYLIHATDKDNGRVLLDGATIKAKHTFFDKTWSNIDVSENQRIVGLGIRMDGELVVIPPEADEPGAESPGDEEVVIPPGVVKPNDNSHTLTGTALGNLAFVNQGADFIRDAAMYAAEEVVLSDKPSLWASAKGEHSRYKTSPDFTLNGTNFAFGLTYKAADTVFLGFLEAGHGNTKTHVPDTSAKSKQNYLGAGLAFKKTFESGWFIDGILRAGRFKSKFNGFYDVGSAHYNANMTYLSADVGAGYVWPVKENLDLVPFVTYRYSYLSGKNALLGDSDNSKVKLGHMDSHETRIGADLVGKVSANTNVRVGAAWSHVYGRKTKVKVNQLALDEISLKGNSAIGSIGVEGKFSENSKWRYQVRVKGFLGDRQGVSGSGLIQYLF